MSTEAGPTSWPMPLTQIPERWMENCKAFSSASQASAERWMKSCTEQAQANLDAFTQLAGCKDAGEIAAVQQRWWQDTVDRLRTEMKGCQDQLMALAQTSLSGLNGGPSSPSRRPPAKTAA